MDHAARRPRSRRGGRRTLGLLATALVALGVAACGGDDDGGEDGSESGSSGETVKIGLITALSGPFAVSGNGTLDGAEAAVEYLNAGNSESGMEFDLLELDDKGDSNQTAQAAAKLASEDIVALLALTTPGAPLAVQPVVNREEIVFLGASQGLEGEMSADGKYPWAFNTYVGQPQFSVKQVEYAEALGETKVGEIYIDDPVGQDFHDSAVAAAEETGLELVSESFSEQQRDLSAQLRNIRDAGVDTLMVWAYGTGLVNVASSLAKVGWEPRVLSVLGATDPAVKDLLEQSAPDALGGMLSGPMASTYIAEKEGDPPPGKLAKAFAEYFTEVSGGGPKDFTGVLSFDGVIALDRGIAEAGSTDPEAIREAFSTTPLEVSQGTTSWPEDRNEVVSTSEIGLFETDSDLTDGAGTAPPAP